MKIARVSIGRRINIHLIDLSIVLPATVYTASEKIPAAERLSHGGVKTVARLPELACSNCEPKHFPEMSDVRLRAAMAYSN